MAPLIDNNVPSFPSTVAGTNFRFSAASKIGINGFGRIGRNVLRASLLRSDVDVVAINHTCATAKDLIHLIRFDSTLGSMHPGIRIVIENEHLITVGGKHIRLISERDPKNIDWHSLGIDYVVESTGKFTKRSAALEHVTLGRARRVIISAPNSDSSAYVFGVNSDKYFPDEDNNVISCASCTTNCVTPVLKVLNDNFGVEQGLLTTVHASTQSQNVLDGYNKKNPRLGRTVFDNIIPTTTGAAKAIATVLPELQGRITGVSIRVPTPSVSMIDLTVDTTKPTSLKEILDAFQLASKTYLAGVLSVCEEELFSSDFKGNPSSAVVDAAACIELNSQFFKMIAWYDNEWGYSNRLLDLAVLLNKGAREYLQYDHCQDVIYYSRKAELLMV
ncbi:hypothetical protein UA08_05316 [Talaromyces atroroseus]|uniref:Glyceraldehyde 3-phosphate dehydrogenase NAD(P) binding domain-containing protein n=1 Tax=Talaromyces atroroseus TaxID=1441469 RepID=A0A225AXD5_TALAT|nr:hypothetical protein UA08_05316 [Talaromyces atroroseus]OKL59646.1 hypothetical protein UA08_05316 [Talaromyces atroroseus]